MRDEEDTPRKARRDLLLVLLILPFGILCMFMTGQVAIRLAPTWVLGADMRSLLDPNAEFAAGGNPFFIEPLDPDILTLPPWGNLFLTPNAQIPTRVILTSTPPINTPLPPVIATPVIPGEATATIPVPIIVPTRREPQQADLLIEKSDNSPTYTPGTAISYTIRVTNLGPNDAPRFNVTDSIPVVITGLTVNCSPAARCGTNTSSGNNISFTGANLSSSGVNQLTISISGIVASGATGNLANIAEVVIPDGVRYSDPDLTNNTVTDTDTQLSVYDLAITKSDGVDTYTATAPITYTIVVTNSGPSDALGVTITDIKPPQIPSWGWCVSPCTPNPNASISDFSATVNITSGGSIQYSLSAIPPGVSEAISNTASLVIPSGPGTIVEQNPANNSATDVNTPFIDLQITKDDGVTNYTPGGNLTYTVNVTNNSTFNLTGVSVTDNIPLLINSWTWSCVPGPGASCTPGPFATDLNDPAVILPSGTSVTYTIDAIVDGLASGTLENTATVNPPPGLVDTVPGNNTATDSDFDEPDFGAPDGNILEIPEGTTATFNLPQAIVANGDAAADFVFYEFPMSPGINLDHIVIEISTNGSAWYQVFFWGDTTADTNTNINYASISGACPTEIDNCPIPGADLYPYPGTGITIDVDSSPLSGPIPLENYFWIRFTEPGLPGSDGDNTHVDAIQILP